MGINVGEITYTNILPLYYHLDRPSLKQIGFVFEPQIPSRLNEAMSKGLIDIGGISSFSYGEHFKDYSILPDLSVSSIGSVGSIFLFSKVPLKNLDKKAIALTSSSATSVNLLKVILQSFYNINAKYTVMHPNFKTMMQTNDACLLIGDDAILSYWKLAKTYYCYDLGELWFKHTNLPMTYAVLAVRNEVIQEKQTYVDLLYKEFLTSKKKSMEDHFREMIESIRRKLGGSKIFWMDYFKGLNYDFSEKHQEGLYYYFDLANQLGLIKKVEQITIWNMADHYHTIK